MIPADAANRVKEKGEKREKKNWGRRRRGKQ